MDSDLVSPKSPTFYFIGMTTSKSSIMRVFPAWSQHLNLNACIVGIDCKWHDDPDRYRRVVQFIKDERYALGALITTHKLDIYRAAGDLFDGFGQYARSLGEISCISKHGTELWGHAKDPITSGLALNAFLPKNHWQSGAEMCLLGAGGSSLALSVYCMNLKETERPNRIAITNRSSERIDSMKRVHEKVNPGITVDYYYCPNAEKNNEVVSAMPKGSIVANATGLGKDAAGSPLTNAAEFPEGGFAWDFNYRGDLLFLKQAQRQKITHDITIEDGWTYFIHGWTRVMAEVFHIDIQTEGPEFDTLSKIAAAAR